MTWDGNCASGKRQASFHAATSGAWSLGSVHFKFIGHAGSQAQVFCGKNGRSATYVAPRGGNIKLTAASLLCDTLTLVADGGKGAAGQVRGESGGRWYFVLSSISRRYLDSHRKSSATREQCTARFI